MTQNDPGQALTPKQEHFIEALLASSNITIAAHTAGIAYKTGHRWLKLPHIRGAYRDAQKALFDQALTLLMQKVEKAIETLDRNMDDPETPAGTQVRAAQIMLEQAIAVHKMSDLEARLEELESQFGIRGR